MYIFFIILKNFTLRPKKLEFFKKQVHYKVLQNFNILRKIEVSKREPNH